MSKSLGNFYTLRDLLGKGYSGMEVRYMLMHIHYRTQLNFTFEGMEGARKSLHRLNDFVQRMYERSDSNQEPTKECQEALRKAIQIFSESMADDLNISVALAAIFDLMHTVNTLYDSGTLTGGDAHAVFFVMQEFNRVLGVLNFDLDEEAPAELQEMLQKREEARQTKQWARADELRDAITASGYVIEDTDQGPRLKKK